MSKSIAWPFRPNARGGVATDDNLEAIIALGLLPGRSNNPYNKRDNLEPPDFQWEPQTPEAEAQKIALAKSLFRSLEAAGRARLVDIYRNRDAPAGEAETIIRWTNLTTGSTTDTVLSDSVGG